MSDEDKYLPLDQIINLSIKPGAVDLLEIDRRIEVLEKERLSVEARSALLPGKSKRLAEIDAALRGLHLGRMVSREHVFTDPHSTEVYEKQKAVRLEARKQQEAQEARQAALEAARSEPKTGRGALLDYLSRWASKKGSNAPEKEKDAGAETEPR
jgi:ribosomal protein S21